jgi:hypothetical protein
MNKLVFRPARLRKGVDAPDADECAQFAACRGDTDQGSPPAEVVAEPMTPGPLGARALTHTQQRRIMCHD